MDLDIVAIQTCYSDETHKLGAVPLVIVVLKEPLV